MRKQLPPIIVALLVVSALGLSGDQARPPRAVPTANSASNSPNEREGSSIAARGRRVVIDPVTGKLVPTRLPGAAIAAPELNNPLSTSGEGLREVPGRTRGGGVKLHLQGRFRSTITATTSSEGHVTTRCRTESDTR